MSTYNDRHSVRDTLLPIVWLVFLFIIPMVFLVWWFWPRTYSGLDANAEPRPVSPRGTLTAYEKTNIAVYESASASVVHITNLAVISNELTLDDQQIPKGTGSGFIWDEKGHIVTNYHVVNGADAAQVTLADHTTYEARTVWAYPDQDIAVLVIDAPKSKLRPIRVGSSHDLKVGQLTYAIGNPFGLDQTMTVGIVSALGRQIEAENGHPILGVIQTSAAINPGNSGGPLLDNDGRLIGMNTSILSPSGTFAGIGFAIPVDEINEIVTQLIRHGKVVRPQLGVQLASDEVAQELGIEQGALIVKVVPNSPAGRAGLQGTRRDQSGHIQFGDVIVAVDGKPIANGPDLYSALASHNVGDKVTLTIFRDGHQQEVQVTLQAAE